MPEKISNFTQDSHSSYPATSGIKEKIRASFNSKKQTFVLLEKMGDTKKIEYMEQTEGKIISKISVPIDYSSPTLYKNSNKKTNVKAQHLSSQENTRVSDVIQTVSRVISRLNH